MSAIRKGPSVNGARCWSGTRRAGWCGQINGLWKYDPTLVTEVEITFTALSTRETGVDLEHRNLERFGEHATRVQDALGADGGWQGILETYMGYAEKGPSTT